MASGTVTWFDVDKGFGFLTPDDGGPDVFVHARDVLTSGAGAKALAEGQPVDFEVVEGDRGPQAREVRPTGPAPVPPPQVGTLATVSWFDATKGYGFAVPDGSSQDVFVHATAVVTGTPLEEGQRVALVVVPGERGAQGAHVVPLPATPAVSDPDDGADGTVNWYDREKGFGFLTPDGGGPDVFVHFRALAAGLEELVEGQRVAFDVVQSDRGPQARDARPVTPGAASPSGESARGERPRTDRAGTDRAGTDRPRTDRPRTDRPRTERPRSEQDRRSGGRTSAAAPGEGVVVRYDEGRGFGFLRPDDGGEDLFVHVSTIRGGTSLEVGDRVRFGVRQSDRGPQADRVERL